MLLLDCCNAVHFLEPLSDKLHSSFVVNKVIFSDSVFPHILSSSLCARLQTKELDACYAKRDNLARDRARTLKRRPATGSLDDIGHGDAPRFLADQAVVSPDRPIQRKEDVDRLQQAMERLPETDRQVILLRHYSGMSFNEIAELMGTPIGTALARAHRGLAKLRGWMEESI